MNRRIALAATLALPLAAAASGSDGSCLEDPRPIPDPGALERIVAVPASAARQVIVAVRVRLEGTHPWVGDLRATLTHPSGATVTLLDRPGIPSIGFPGPWGCGGDDFRCTLADDAAAAIESTCSFGPAPVLAGPLRPNEALAAFAGLAPEGAWRLVVEDAVAGDAGTLALACLEFDLAPDCNGNGVPDASDLAAGTSVDADGDGVPDECACRADLDGNGAVDAADLAVILASWGACLRCPADLDASGAVDGADLTAMLAAWGGCDRR